MAMEEGQLSMHEGIMVAIYKGENEIEYYLKEYQVNK